MVRLSTAKYGQLRSNYGSSTSIQSLLSVASFWPRSKNINPSTVKLFIRASVITTLSYGQLRSSTIGMFKYGLLRSTTAT